MKTDFQKARKAVNCQIIGDINEVFEFPKIDVRKAEVINVDLEKTKYMNSTGIRKWIVWIQEIQQANPQVEFVFKNVQPIFVRSEAVIFNLLPVPSHVTSFDAPYFCQRCNISAQVRIHLSEVLTQFPEDAQLTHYLESQSCSRCQAPMELDTFPKTIINFIKKYGH